MKVTLTNWHWDFEDAKQSMAHEVWLDDHIAFLVQIIAFGFTFGWMMIWCH